MTIYQTPAPATRAGLSKRRIALLSLLLTLIVWSSFTWPLAKNLFHAIPCGTVHTPHEPVSLFMQPGDHLQLMYHFWMFRDMVVGGTPWFHHMYEFNTGNDEERIEYGSYYFPFSGIYAVGSLLAGDAFGWNLAGFVSLWITVFFTWLLVLRYNTSNLIAAALGVLAISIPYRWYSLLGGSPSGFAMGLVPALLLGLDIAVRDRRLAGGVLAGVAIMFCAWTDMQVFFFATLAMPCWAFFAFLSALPNPSTWFRDLARQAVCLLPVPVGFGAGLATAKLMTRNIETTHAGGGRTIAEVGLFSPRPPGVFGTESLGMSNHVFLGYAIAALLAVALLIAILHVRRDAGLRQLALLLVLLAGVYGIVALALGPFGYFEGRAFTAARKFLPEYDMIRQPAKVYCLLPSILAVAAAIGFQPLAGRKLAQGVAPALTLLAIVQCNAQFAPMLCRLDEPSSAYKALADDAKAQGVRPHAMVVPLWPGDSHQTAIYQYYSRFERLRLVNGYLPFVPKDYISSIFDRFRSINVGYLDDGQLDELLQRGITHVVLHEDMYPEKVSPFPVASALRNFLNHPRLERVAQDRSIWVFRILKQTVAKQPVGESWAYTFAASLREIENSRGLRLSGIFEDPRANRGKYVRFAGAGSTGNVGVEMIGPHEDLRWTLRYRGKADLQWVHSVNGVETRTSQSLESADWTWISIPVPPLASFSKLLFDWVLKDGLLEVDCAYLAAGKPLVLAPGEPVTIAAPNFFHAGHIDLETDSVSFDPEMERRGIIFYGPKLPVGLGRFAMSSTVQTDAAPGTPLGTWIVACPEGNEIARGNLVAGSPFSLPFSITNDLPLLIAFDYAGIAPMSVKSITLERTL